jgi:hypothetical protein
MSVVTFPDPSPTSDAGKVLRAIRTRPGCPAWAVARNAQMPLSRVWSALPYLRLRRKIHARRAPFLDPRTNGERSFKCWHPGAAASRGAQIGERCTAAIGFGVECRAKLVERVDRVGNVTYACEKCERRAQGVCRTCPNPLAPKAKFGPSPWYCVPCELTNRRLRAREAYREKNGVQPEAMRV